MDSNIKKLVKKLGSWRWHIRSGTAKALGKTGDREAVQPLIKALKDKHENVRRSAAEALGEIGDPSSVQPLIEAMKDKNESVRLKAAESLGGQMKKRFMSVSGQSSRKKPGTQT